MTYQYNYRKAPDNEIDIELDKEKLTLLCYEGLESASISIPMSEVRILGALFTQYAREADYVVRNSKLTGNH